MIEMNLFTELKDTENKLMLPKGKDGGRRDKLGIWD